MDINIYSSSHFFSPISPSSLIAFQIVFDAAHIILNKDKDKFSGNFVLDDSLLAEHGETDFSKYADYPFAELIPDFFVPEDAYPVPQVVKDS